MDKSTLHILEEMPVRKAIVTLAIPTVVSMLVQILYNVTDTFFIGKLNDPIQLAAVSICFPLFMLQMAISGIFGNGAASYISRLLGQKEYNSARETATLALASTVISSILIAFLGITFSRDILRFAGASTNTMPYAIMYLRIIVAGSPILMLNFAMAQLLRAEGATKTVMKGNLFGTLTNIVLDPLFIFWFDMGVAGVAVATLIGAGLSLTYLSSIYLRKKSIALPSVRYLKPRWAIFSEIFKIGIPASLGQIMMSIGNSISFSVAARYGDVAVAAFGVVWRVMSLPVFIFIGLSIALQPLVGYNYGANNRTRLKQSVRATILMSSFLSVFLLVLFFLFPRALIQAFINSPEVVDLGARVLVAFTFAIPFIGIQMPLMTSIQAMGKGFPSLIISVSRNGLVYIPSVYLLNHYFGFGGLTYALTISDVISALMAAWFFRNAMNSIRTSSFMGRT